MSFYIESIPSLVQAFESLIITRKYGSKAIGCRVGFLYQLLIFLSKFCKKCYLNHVNLNPSRNDRDILVEVPHPLFKFCRQNWDFLKTILWPRPTSENDWGKQLLPACSVGVWPDGAGYWMLCICLAPLLSKGIKLKASYKMRKSYWN